MKKKIYIGGRSVGDDSRCFIVFEAGPTIFDLESGRKLCKAAADAGADAIKFQIMDVDRLMPDKSVEFTYGTHNGKVTEKLYDILKRRELTFDEWRKIKSYCDELGILFFSTALFPEEVDFLKEIGSCAIKIAAGDINHTYLIEYASKSGLPVILDARGSEEELANAVKICKGTDIMIMHCPPGYPCDDEDVNMSVLQYLKEKFNCPIGFSDHSINATMDYACLGYGADCIEKTITLDKKTQSAEHYMSLEPSELLDFVNDIRRIEQAIGKPSSVFSIEPASAGRRSIAAKRELRKGDVLTLDDIDFMRPGTGIAPDSYNELIGRKLLVDVKKSKFFTEDMLAK